MLWRKKAILGIIAFTILLLSVTTHAQSTRYTIVDNTVYINDTNAYISASPYRIIDSGWVEINMESKTYSGFVNVVLGVNTSDTWPTKVQRYNPHEITEEKSFTCDLPGYFYNYTLSPRHFWCWSNSTDPTTNITYTDLVFEHDFDYADIPSSTAYWNETHIEEWSDVDNVVDKKINYDFDDKNLWYYASNVPITSGSKYRIWMYTTIGFDKKGKYDLGFYPSSYGSNIIQANQDGNLYYLDPWYDSSWGACVNVTSSGTATESGWFTHVIPMNSTVIDYSKVLANGDDIRLVTGNCSSIETGATALPIYLQHYSSSDNWFLYANSTAGKTNFALYYNNSGASNVSDIRGVAYAWDTGDLSANSSYPSNGNLLVGAGGWLADYSSQNEWTYTNTYAFSGTLGMKHDASSGGARVYFSAGVNAPQTLEFWIRDYATDTNGVLMLNKNNPNHGGSDKGWFGIFAEGGGALQTNYGYYNGAWTSSGLPRSTNWHKIIIKSDGTTVNLFYANLTNPTEQYVTNITQSMTALSPTIDARSETNPYFDEVIVRPYSYKDNTYTFSAEETAPSSDTTAPTWSLNSTNDTTVSSNTTFSVLWQDDIALSNYSFAYCGSFGTGQFTCYTGWEDSGTIDFGATGWVNFTKVLESTEGLTVAWYTNATDTSGNFNQSGGSSCGGSRGTCDMFTLTAGAGGGNCWVQTGNQLYVPDGCQYYITGSEFI